MNNDKRLQFGGPAFPQLIPGDDGETFVFPGMTLRDHFAGQALKALGRHNPNLPDDPASHLGWPEPQDLADRRAKWAYMQADAMLAAREVQP